jgi:hypothetical protein
MLCEEFIDVFKEEKTGIVRRRREGWTKSLEQARATGKRFGRRIGDKLEADIRNALKRGDKGILRLADEFRVRPSNRSETQARTAGGSEMSEGRHPSDQAHAMVGNPGDEGELPGVGVYWGRAKGSGQGLSEPAGHG